MSAKYLFIVAVALAACRSGYALEKAAPDMDDPLFASMTNAQKQQIVMSPIGKVIGMLQNLKQEVDVDGQREKLSYNKYACWCENTIANKTQSMADNIEQVKQVSAVIEKSKGDSAAMAVEVKHVEKEIATAQTSTQEATQIRTEEAAAFQEQKTETDSALQALEQAIAIIKSVMSTGFLEKRKHAQLMSVVGGIRSVLNMKIASKIVREELEVVQRFVENPEDFVKQGGVSALQVDPFAPQSDQIGGILQEMKHQFEQDFDRASKEENIKANAYTELVNTKNEELASLQTNLQQATREEAEESKAGAENAVLREELNTKIADDTKLIADVKAGCKKKAEQWSLRSSARTEELLGINEALHYLASDKALEAFNKVGPALLQVSKTVDSPQKRDKAFQLLSTAAQVSKSTSVAEIAAALKTGGSFEDIIGQLDNTITELRKEDKNDEAARDRCSTELKANKDAIEKLEVDVNASSREITRLASHATVLENTISRSEAEIASSRSMLAEMTTNRAADKAMLEEAIKWNVEAQGFVQGAMAMLSKFYGSAAMIQQAPPSHLGPSTAETTFQSKYDGRHEGGSAVVAVLDIINKDISKDLAEQREEELEAEKTFQETKKELEASIEAETIAMNQVREELGEAMQSKAVKVQYKQEKDADLDGELEKQRALETECNWIVPYFETRRSKRNAEIAGMEQAQTALRVQ